MPQKRQANCGKFVHNNNQDSSGGGGSRILSCCAFARAFVVQQATSLPSSGRGVCTFMNVSWVTRVCRTVLRQLAPPLACYWLGRWVQMRMSEYEQLPGHKMIQFSGRNGRTTLSPMNECACCYCGRSLGRLAVFKKSRTRVMHARPFVTNESRRLNLNARAYSFEYDAALIRTTQNHSLAESYSRQEEKRKRPPCAYYDRLRVAGDRGRSDRHNSRAH